MTKEFDARNERKSRSVCAAMAEAADTGKRVLSEKERRILDMWPRYDDGEPVMIGDGVDGLGGEIIEVYIAENTASIWNNSANHMHLSPGERVKRPVQSVLDADGVEIKVGDTVWDDDGVEMTVMSLVGELPGHVTTHSKNPPATYSINPKRLTHTHPDNWERLEEDAVKVVCEYAGAVPDEFGDYDCDTCRLFDARGNLICEQLMTREIVRRAKALAGVEVDG